LPPPKIKAKGGKPIPEEDDFEEVEEVEVGDEDEDDD
jgi:hypothetical protein